MATIFWGLEQLSSGSHIYSGQGDTNWGHRRLPSSWKSVDDLSSALSKFRGRFRQIGCGPWKYPPLHLQIGWLQWKSRSSGHCKVPLWADASLSLTPWPRWKVPPLPCCQL
jgi:hypothetical protein